MPRQTALIAEDEPLLRDALIRQLARVWPDLDVIAQARNGREAINLFEAKRPDICFLDIHMPGLSGIDAANRIGRRAHVVFVTAHDHYAVQAFAHGALDYLLKPVGRQRLQEALERVAAAVAAGEAPGRAVEVAGPSHADRDGDVIAVANPRSGSTRLVQRSSILYAQSHGDFVRIVVEDGRYLLRATLVDLEHRWEPFGFVRVHRQYLANLTNAVELRPELGGTAVLVFADGQTIPVARRHVGELSRRLSI